MSKSPHYFDVIQFWQKSPAIPVIACRRLSRTDEGSLDLGLVRNLKTALKLSNRSSTPIPYFHKLIAVSPLSMLVIRFTKDL